MLDAVFSGVHLQDTQTGGVCESLMRSLERSTDENLAIGAAATLGTFPTLGDSLMLLSAKL
ncbi:MAG: hypothetical protein O3A00_02890 [Planctomycetota bacterium]|nr:hypothetical protein [Planctomycetota bacterium]